MTIKDLESLYATLEPSSGKDFIRQIKAEIEKFVKGYISIQE